MDLIDATDLVMKKFGFRIRDKIANQFRWQVALVTVFACFDMFNAVTAFIPLENNERLLQILLDPGYAGFGPKYRYILNILYGYFRLNLFTLQLFFVFDTHHWLVNANTQFKKVNSIHIVESEIHKTTAKAKRVAIYILISFTFVDIFQLATQSYRNYKQNQQPLDFLYYYTLVHWTVSLILQQFYSSAYFVQYYILTKLSVQFVQQYNLHLTRLLRKKGFISSERMLHELRQFSHLYLLIQYLKVFLKRTYLTSVLCIFGVSTQCYYTALYTDIVLYQRGAQLCLFALLLAIIVQLSVTTDRINTECRQMSNRIYKAFIRSKNHHYSAKFQFEVGINLDHSHLLN